MKQKLIDVFEDIIKNANTYITILIIGLQIGMFVGALYHLLVRGDSVTAIFFMFIALVLAGFYAD
tara:strand:- start:271 stop:465 length:195 start_codon:yes stop_codon:yes gene_type:complete